MRRYASIALLVMTAIPAFAAKKVEGTTILKDSQPTGTTDKEHKHQAYDLSFNAAGNLYTCRTSSDKSMNATDFVVGSQMTYQIDGKKAKLKTPEGKEVECKVVRVEAPTTP
ncbi:MAG TPA: hypothetical protein VK798_16310 [Alloacidobacterium sp.]|nr:hypothetical protein [Alloacidobacterium sp.]